jgi:hypothetical protein
MSIVAKQAKSDGELEVRGASGVLIKVLLLVRGDTPEVLSLHARATGDKKPIPCFLVRSDPDTQACPWWACAVMQRHHPTGRFAASQKLSSGVCLAALRRGLARASS